MCLGLCVLGCWCGVSVCLRVWSVVCAEMDETGAYTMHIRHTPFSCTTHTHTATHSEVEQTRWMVPKRVVCSVDSVRTKPRHATVILYTLSIWFKGVLFKWQNNVRQADRQHLKTSYTILVIGRCEWWMENGIYSKLEWWYSFIAKHFVVLGFRIRRLGSCSIWCPRLKRLFENQRVNCVCFLNTFGWIGYCNRIWSKHTHTSWNYCYMWYVINTRKIHARACIRRMGTYSEIGSSVYAFALWSLRHASSHRIDIVIFYFITSFHSSVFSVESSFCYSFIRRFTNASNI